MSPSAVPVELSQVQGGHQVRVQIDVLHGNLALQRHGVLQPQGDSTDDGAFAHGGIQFQLRGSPVGIQVTPKTANHFASHVQIHNAEAAFRLRPPERAAGFQPEGNLPSERQLGSSDLAEIGQRQRGAYQVGGQGTVRKTVSHRAGHDSGAAGFFRPRGEEAQFRVAQPHLVRHHAELTAEAVERHGVGFRFGHIQQAGQHRLCARSPPMELSGNRSFQRILYARELHQRLDRNFFQIELARPLILWPEFPIFQLQLAVDVRLHLTPDSMAACDD
jgi:hypothetical protein